MTNRPGNRRDLGTGNDVRNLLLCGAAMAVAASLSSCGGKSDDAKTAATGPSVVATFILPPGSSKLPTNGPAAYCRQPDTIRKMLASFSTAGSVSAAGEHAIDFIGATTTAIDDHAMTFSCHGTFRLSNGQDLPGTFSLIKNSAGDPQWSWVNDPSSEDVEADNKAANAAALADQINSEYKTDSQSMQRAQIAAQDSMNRRAACLNYQAIAKVAIDFKKRGNIVEVAERTIGEFPMRGFSDFQQVSLIRAAYAVPEHSNITNDGFPDFAYKACIEGNIF